MKVTIFVTLLLCAEVSAQEMRQVIEVKDGLIRDFDDQMHDVKGGAYLDSTALQYTAREIVYLRTKNAEQTNTMVALIACILIAGAGGFAAGKLLK